MSDITYEGLCKKGGFDIRAAFLTPDKQEEQTYICDDHTPSKWSVFTEKEKDWIYENVIRELIADGKIFYKKDIDNGQG